MAGALPAPRPAERTPLDPRRAPWPAAPPAPLPGTLEGGQRTRPERTPLAPGRARWPAAASAALEVTLEVGQRPPHDGVGDQRAHRSGDEAAGIDAQVELHARAPAVERLEAPLAVEGAEVAAEV